jgi:ligand-binding sensor domain-containing protein
MKNLAYHFFIILLIVSSSLSYSQIPKWVNYNTSNSGLPNNYINLITIDKFNNKWIGTEKGLVKFDGTNWTVFNTSNSGLTDNTIYSIAIDSANNKWIGTYKGLAKFDGTNWIVYNSSNSGLPDDYITTIIIDSTNNKWCGTMEGYFVKFNDTSRIVDYSKKLGRDFQYAIDKIGNIWAGGYASLFKFDGTNWTDYHEIISIMNMNMIINSISIDDAGNKWLATNKGLAKYNDTTLFIFTESNSPLIYGIHNLINTISMDHAGNKWVGANYGLFKFDGTNWTVYNTSNSLLLNNWITSIAFDKAGNKWIGTNLGLTVFNENGVVTGVQEKPDAAVSSYSLSQSYPNPFNPSTIISYEIKTAEFVTLKVYDILGREVSTLVNSYQNAGVHKVNFNASSLASGVYIYRISAGSKLSESRKMILIR